MSAWSSTRAVDETAERVLFARRSRALELPQPPSLEAVLEAVDDTREARAAATGRLARSRALVATALAAACVLGVAARLPKTDRRAAIVADVDGGATRLSSEPSTSTSPGSSCAMSESAMSSEESACFETASVVQAIAPAVSRIAPSPPVDPVVLSTTSDEGPSCDSRLTCEACGSCESTDP